MADVKCMLGCMAITALILTVTCWLFAIYCASYLTYATLEGISAWHTSGYKRVK